MKSLSSRRVGGARRGFTLIELIAVIAVIAILMGIGATTLKNVTTARGVGTGVPLAENVFDEAQAVAKGRGIDAFVVIYADTKVSDPDMQQKLFRYMGVATAREARDSSGNPDPSADSELRLIGRGTELPAGVFFNAKASGLPATPNGKAFIPGVAGESDCYVYRFNSEGILVEPTTGGASGPQAKFVIQSGVMRPGDTQPRALPKSKRDIGGFAIWRSGQTSIFRHPDQIMTGDSEF